MPAFLFCKRNKICYNKSMQQNTQRTNGKFLGEPTAATASGLAFSVASVLPTLLSLLFLVIVGAMQTEGYAQTDWYLYVSYLLPQIAFAITAIWFLRFSKTPVKTAIAAQKCKPRYFLLALTIQIGLLSLSELNALFLKFLERFGYEDVGITLPNMDGFGFVGVLVVVALVPAVFEEIMFRGVLLKGLKGFGETDAVLLCGALFALYHQNPAQTLYQFCCGAAFALVAIRSGSILPTVLSHFLNNALILTLTKFEISAFSTPVLIAIVSASAACLVGSLVWVFVFDKQEKTEKTDKTDKKDKKNFFLCASVGIAVCAITWLAVLINGL